MSAKLPGGDGASDAPVSEPRLDYLGLFKHFAKEEAKLSALLKEAHGKGTRLAGNLFSALICASGGPARTIDAAGWVALRDSKVISEKDFLEGISVSVSLAEDVLSKADFKKVVRKSHGKAGKSLTALKHLEGAEASVLAIIEHLEKEMRQVVEERAIDMASSQGRAA